MERVLSFEQALAEVMRHATDVRAAMQQSAARETLPLAAAMGRVLAEPVLAPRDQPAFDRSTRDGYAVRSADLTAGRALELIGTLRAGERWTRSPIADGQTIEIMTGAPLPPGADAVLMVEHAALLKGRLQPAAGRVLVAGENVVPRASEARAGATLLTSGRCLDAAAIAAAAGAGVASVQVFARPRVAIVATGDELVELGEGTPEPWQIFNSNSYALAALVESAGGEPLRLPIARDTVEDLRARLHEARDADLLLLSGGVSMGKFDLVEQLLAEAGAEFFCTGAKIQPGKPVVFGRLPRPERNGWQYFFGLPGNPVSAEVCFHLFAATLLRGLAGALALAPRFVGATAAHAFAGKPGLTRFLPCALDGGWRGVQVRAVRWQGSGDTAANAMAHGFCVIDEGGITAGDAARVLLR